MSVLHVNHIKAKLAEIYKGKIDISDSRSEQDKENFFLTRSFGAYTLQVLANDKKETYIPHGIVKSSF